MALSVAIVYIVYFTNIYGYGNKRAVLYERGENNNNNNTTRNDAAFTIK